MNTQKPRKRTRSANAPAIRAGVMIANLPWNIAKTYCGMPSFMIVVSMPFNRKKSQLQPHQPCVSPKAIA
jgi:hypothetical protein